MFKRRNYWRLTDKELEEEAERFKISGYANAHGPIDRNIIIEQLIKKDNANNARIAIWATAITIIIAVVSLAIRS